MDDLNGRTAIVTGASRGIGRAIAMALAEAGARVAINYRARAAEAAAVGQAIGELGGKALAIQADVGRAEDVQRLVHTCEERLGAVDLLVNNAAISRPQQLADITEQD